MVKEIVRDVDFLQTKSEKANIKSNTVEETIRDLIDTAEAHKDKCVGLSAIQIGVPLRICVVYNGERFISFVNPA